MNWKKRIDNQKEIWYISENTSDFSNQNRISLHLSVDRYNPRSCYIFSIHVNHPKRSSSLSGLFGEFRIRAKSFKGAMKQVEAIWEDLKNNINSF